ncbi:hypothetical protein BH10BAC6_BH10BAC6_11600 [soil metagenome]
MTAPVENYHVVMAVAKHYIAMPTFICHVSGVS